WPSELIFAVIITDPAIGWRRLGWNPILSFWLAYVVTRPLGASFADGFSKPNNGGLGAGDGPISAIALIVFIGLVAYVAVTKLDVQDASHAEHPHLYLEPHPDQEHQPRLAAEL